MSSNRNTVPAQYHLTQSGQTVTLRATGDWTLKHVGDIDPVLTRDLEGLDYDNVQYDFSGVGKLDTAGAFMFARAVRIGPGERHKWEVIEGNQGQRTLMQAAADSVWGTAMV